MNRNLFFLSVFCLHSINASELVSIGTIALLPAGASLLSDTILNSTVLMSEKKSSERTSAIVFSSVRNAINNPWYGISLGLGLGLAAKMGGYTNIGRLMVPIAGITACVTAKSTLDLYKTKDDKTRRTILNNHRWMFGIGVLGIGLFAFMSPSAQGPITNEQIKEHLMKQGMDAAVKHGPGILARTLGWPF